ncbi:unnamed protein product [Mortierella alpina]
MRLYRTSNLSSTFAQYGVLFRIKGLPNMRIMHVVLSKDVVKPLSIQPKTLSCLCKLSIEAAPGSVGGKELTALAAVLKTNSTLTTFDLTNNSIGDSGAKVLAEAFKTNSTLTTLILSHNSIGCDGAQALAEALKTNSILTTVDLSDNSIAIGGILALALKVYPRTTLHLSRNSITGSQALFEAFKIKSTVATLNLLGNSIGDDGAKALAEALKTNKTVATLDLRSNLIGDDGAKALAGALKTNSTVTTLALGYNPLGATSN